MITVIIDFETRSETMLGDVGICKYAEHTSTDALCMAYKIDSEGTKLWTRTNQAIPTDFLEALNSGAYIEAYNSFFEYNIWTKVMIQRYGFPEVPIDRFICTAARAAQFSLPRKLEEAAKALNLPVEKDMEGHRIMLQLCKPKKPSKKDPSIWYEEEEKYNKLYTYCIRDVDVTYELRKKLLILTRLKNNLMDKLPVPKNRELEIFRLNNTINLSGVSCDVVAASKAKEIVKAHEKVLNEKLSIITNGELISGSQVKAITEFINKKGYKIPDVRSDTIDLWLPNMEGIAKEVLEIRKALSKSSIKKLDAMLDRASLDSRIRDLIVYYGACRTGRFSGSGIQVQNMSRPSLDNENIEKIFNLLKQNISYTAFAAKFPDVYEAISSSLRGMLVPREGYKFYDSDFSAIEAHVLFWIADDTLGLEAYRQKKDIYKQMASAIYDIPEHEITKDFRMLGKQAVLGCGYSMGVQKFVETCAGYGIVISEELAEKAVYTYRSRYAKVSELWGNIEKASIEAILNPGTIYNTNKLYFYYTADFLFIVLPSGRALAYHKPQLEKNPWGRINIKYMGFNTQIKKYTETRTYGGKLVENIVQATARDFMTEAMLRVNAEGYNIVFTVHDQILVEVKTEDSNINHFDSLMKQVPEWGLGCPIDTETQECFRFKK